MFMKPYQIENIKKQYPIGSRVRLNSMSGEQQMPSGLEGKVEFVDDAGQIHVNWNNGSTLALFIGEDSFERIAEPEQEKGIHMKGM